MSMSKKNNLRRSGAKIMASLILLLGSLAYIMVLAVINGSVGFICAMGVTLMGAVGVAKALGEPQADGRRYSDCYTAPDNEVVLEAHRNR